MLCTVLPVSAMEHITHRVSCLEVRHTRVRILTTQTHTYTSKNVASHCIEKPLSSALDAKRSQRQNPGLCILVQKALMKSICLAASLSIESAHLGPVDDGRAGRLGRIEEEL